MYVDIRWSRLFINTWHKFWLSRFLIFNSIALIKQVSIRCGLVVRIPGFHPGGPGSIPGTGTVIFVIVKTQHENSVSIFHFLLRVITGWLLGLGAKKSWSHFFFFFFRGSGNLENFYFVSSSEEFNDKKIMGVMYLFRGFCICLFRNRLTTKVTQKSLS